MSDWKRIEAGYYRLRKDPTVELVHMNHTPMDWMYVDRWVLRRVTPGDRRTGRSMDITELGRYWTMADAKQAAVDKGLT